MTEHTQALNVEVDLEGLEDRVRRTVAYRQLRPADGHSGYVTNADLRSVLALLSELRALRGALHGVSDDYMTSEKHHPGYVLIPTAKFEQLAEASLSAQPTKGAADGRAQDPEA